MSQAPSQTFSPTRVRYGVLLLACILSMITYLDRVCFGTVAPHIQTEFGLTDDQLGMIFSAFALAYAVFEVPSGWLGDVFGPRKTLIRIVICWSIFTVMTGLIWPSSESGTFWATLPFLSMLAVRFLFGMGEAGAYPNITRAFHNWIPFKERGTAQGAVWMAGRFAGGITAFIVTALLITTVLDDGSKVVHWRHTFWIFGGIGIIWCMVFSWWFRDRPEQKEGVNQAELELIRAGTHSEPAHANVPWLKLLGNLNLWILCAMYFCAAYGWYFNITWLPKFLKQQYGIIPGDRWSWEFWQFGLMAGAPLLVGSVACLFGGVLTDQFIRRTGNRKWGRRLFGVVGHGLCAVCYFWALYANSAWMFVLAIAAAAFWNDMTMGSAWASCQDIGQKYAGIVSGCMNTIGNLGGAVAGYATGLVLKMHTDAVPEGSPADAVMAASRAGWQINFYIFASVYVAAAVLWLLFDATKPVVPDEH